MRSTGRRWTILAYGAVCVVVATVLHGLLFTQAYSIAWSPGVDLVYAAGEALEMPGAADARHALKTGSATGTTRAWLWRWWVEGWVRRNVLIAITTGVTLLLYDYLVLRPVRNAPQCANCGALLRRLTEARCTKCGQRL
ncbi:MAG: hypothetical protein PVJ57_03125 [Phycisphaerae bacterium]|jgi:hypothetical protein